MAADMNGTEAGRPVWLGQGVWLLLAVGQGPRAEETPGTQNAAANPRRGRRVGWDRRWLQPVHALVAGVASASARGRHSATQLRSVASSDKMDATTAAEPAAPTEEGVPPAAAAEPPQQQLEPEQQPEPEQQQPEPEQPQAEPEPEPATVEATLVTGAETAVPITS